MNVFLQRELELAVPLALQAGHLITELQAPALAVERKAGGEPVTQADRDANALIVSALRAGFADDAILSEEEPDDGMRFERERVWMIDPLDGTNDYIRGADGFAVMIGLLDREGPALGVVYQPRGGRLYHAARGQGAFVVEPGQTARRLHASDRTELTALRLVASKSHRSEHIDRVRARLGINDELNVGSVGLKLGLIARGDRDLYVNPSGYSKLWDTCAPEAVLAEAGGRLSDLDGQPLDYRGRDLSNRRGLIASNGVTHPAIVERLRPLFARPTS